MFKASGFLSTVILALCVAARPLEEQPRSILPFAVKFGNLTRPIAEIDRSRAAAFKNHANGLEKRDGTSFDVTNSAFTYVASVSVGNPATNYDLIIDTGSSNTWIGANSPFQKTKTSSDTGNSVSVSYGSGSFSGEEWIDQVALGDNLVIKKQSIGVASTATGFDGVDGILGIGPVALTKGTLSNARSTVTTVTDNLFSQGTIDSNSIGIYYEPNTSSDPVVNGELTFGGTDSSKFTGTIKFAPITSTSPANKFWGVDQTITYGSGSGTTILKSSAGIVDTGTTLVLIATDAYKKYMSATGATADSATGLLKISTTKFSQMKSLFFNIAGNKYELTANAQSWPRSLNTLLGGTSNNVYLVVADLGSPSGQGLDFINGYAFLERFYTVYDTTNHRVGFATTAHTMDEN